MGSGRIVSVIGAVIDVEFSRDEVPQVYDALKIEENDITLEVQQQLGDGVVRTIAMGSSEGIARGLAVANTSAPISVTAPRANSTNRAVGLPFNSGSSRNTDGFRGRVSSFAPTKPGRN